MDVDTGKGEEREYVGEEGVTEEQLPRPSPWNYFSREMKVVKTPAQKEEMPSRGEALRTWAAESGLDENSRFLEHWFGLSNADAVIMTDKLPRPSPWNKFVEESKPAVKAETNGFALRAWTHDAGLAEDSQFLSHWFGLSNAEKKRTIRT